MSLSLRDAWLVLGRDPEKVATAVSSSKDQGEAAEAVLLEARKAAKKLMALHHPDRQGSPESFALARDALAVVEEKTAKFKEMLSRGDGRRGSAVFIEVDIP